MQLEKIYQRRPVIFLFFYRHLKQKEAALPLAHDILV